jgi:hypothetical protein
MCRRGNDLVRRYLWMAALSAIRFNPAVRALYARVVAKHPTSKAVAVGHAMRKLLHLAFAVWKTGKPFDPAHYPWATPAHAAADVAERASVPAAEAPTTTRSLATSATEKEPAAGLTPDVPAQPEVTAAGSITSTPSPSPTAAQDQGPYVDFGHVKQQLPMGRVLDQLGLAARLRGGGPQKRCTCPIHRGDQRGRTFSVHLGQGVFQCFAKCCGKKGDVIDLWASVKGLSLRQAALDLIQTFALEPAPRARNREENG